MDQKNDRSMSSSLEDYLEAIAEIIEHNGHAHTKDIADMLNVSMPSVTNALQSLAARGLIVYRSHLPVQLTGEGSAKASVIRRRHATLKRFFKEMLKLDELQADSSACKIEHVIGETALERLAALTEAIAGREDCEALRKFIAETMPTIHPDNDSELVSLDKLPQDKIGIVVKVAESLRGIKKFADMGLVPGTLVQFEGTAPFGDLIRIKIMGSCLSIRSSDAMYIWVRIVR